MSIEHETLRASWKRWAARDVVVTVEAPGRIAVDYVDGCGGQPRGRVALSLAHVERFAMYWTSYTLVDLDGVCTEQRGWLHDDFDSVSSPEADALEKTRRDEAADSHPRIVELEWRCHETALAYQARGIDMGHVVPPTRFRPDQATIEGAPL